MGLMTETPLTSDIQKERPIPLERPLYTATLTRKLCLSEAAQCFHLVFQVEELVQFDFAGRAVCFPGDSRCHRARRRRVPIRSPRRLGGNEFDLCVNRVEGGFFSNLLCDLNEGESVKFHGPHGYFLLRQPFDGFDSDRDWDWHCADARICAGALSRSWTACRRRPQRRPSDLDGLRDALCERYLLPGVLRETCCRMETSTTSRR